DYPSALKWFHAVKLYLKDRLKLDISNEKSKIVNLRKRKSEFLGFTICVKQKGKNGFVIRIFLTKRKIKLKKRLNKELKIFKRALQHKMLSYLML
ncbi:maturase, partial [Enterococcus faecium]